TIVAKDDKGLRDPPIVYYSMTEPDDPKSPDVTQFSQRETEYAGDDRWIAWLPSLGLAPGEATTVYLLASATDNDDTSGSTCDLRTDTSLRAFTAIGSHNIAPTCAPCDTSSQCQSGVCGT